MRLFLLSWYRRFYCPSKNMIHFDSQGLETNRPWEHHWYKNYYSCSYHNTALYQIYLHLYSWFLKTIFESSMRQYISALYTYFLSLPLICLFFFALSFLLFINFSLLSMKYLTFLGISWSSSLRGASFLFFWLLNKRRII